MTCATKGARPAVEELADGRCLSCLTTEVISADAVGGLFGHEGIRMCWPCLASLAKRMARTHPTEQGRWRP